MSGLTLPVALSLRRLAATHRSACCYCGNIYGMCGVSALDVQPTRLTFIVSHVQMSAMQLASPSYCWCYMLVRWFPLLVLLGLTMCFCLGAHQSIW
jgi:hypothetical protein